MKKDMKKKRSDPGARERAEQLLSEVAEITGRIRAVEDNVQQQIAAVTAKYADALATERSRLKSLEKEIRQISKKNKKLFFRGESDRLQLVSGALLYSVTNRVKRIRGAVAKIEAAGIDHVIKIAKSVNWDAVEDLDDGALERIGTCRVKKEVYEYEIKDQAKGG